MNDWNMLDWLVAFGVIASLVCAIFAGWSLFRRARKSETIQSFASGKNSRLTQVQASPNSTIVMDSPSTVVVRGNLNITPGYDINEHERIVNERVAQVRADIERAHQAEIDGLQAQLSALTEPEWDQNMIKAVQGALTEKRFDRAEELMAEIEETHLVATSIPAAEKQVCIRQMRAAIALVNGDARKASEHLEKAAALISTFDPVEAAEFRNDGAMHMQDYGERVGGDGIVEAIELYRINAGQLNCETHPEAWAETQHNLGNALLLHGMRSKDGLQLLVEAIEAFRNALHVCTHEAHPGNWAKTQISLGGALMALAKRSGQEEGTRYLTEAVNILRVAAQQVRTPEADPDCWANIQSNLGAALSQQGVWRGGNVGARLLREAVEIYRSILEVRTRETDPLEWASDQANLSCSLAQEAALLEGDIAVGLLDEAVLTARAALQVYTKKEYPLSWARTHGNIGVVLNDLSYFKEGKEALEHVQASTLAFQTALEVYTREDLPLQWAGIQRNLSATFLHEAQIKEHQGGLGAISKAVSACHDALQVFTRTGNPLDWGATQFNLGAALLYRGELTGSTEALASLEGAASAFESAKKIYVREAHPTNWADVHSCLGRVYESMGDLDSGRALEHYRRALREIDRALDVSPIQHKRGCYEDARSTRERLIEKLGLLSS